MYASTSSGTDGEVSVFMVLSIGDNKEPTNARE
jgi:hypothetical protein